MKTTAAGKPLLQAMALAYQANLPVLLHGRHGAGKSALLKQAATQLDIGCVVRDLSLMEPPDLVGMPQVGEDNRTHYAVPAFLPTAGSGLLVFEELNRCPRYMQGPCLQLLTERQLNDYSLPPGWLPCAAVNDAEEGYLTDELDLALLSRFLHVHVRPDVTEWVRWARDTTHPKVVEFVEQSPGIFDDPAANPRAWTQVSQLVSAWEQHAGQPDLLANTLPGVLGEKWAVAFQQFYTDVRQPLQAHEILEEYPGHRLRVRRWVKHGQLDLVAASIELLKRHLQPQRMYDAVCQNVAQKANIEAFLADLPGDLHQQTGAWLTERGFTELLVARRRRKRAQP